MTSVGADLTSYDDDDVDTAPHVQHGRVTRNHILVALFSTLSGVTIGYTTSILGIAMPLLKDILKLSFRWQEYIIGILSIGAAVSSAFAPILNDLIGRRRSIVLSCVIMMIGDIMMFKIDDKKVLAGGRFVSGLGIGLSSSTVPVYISECAPTFRRGQLTVLFQLSIAMGYLVSALVTSFTDITVSSVRLVVSADTCIAIVQFVAMIAMPESPRWLTQHGSLEEAHTVFTWLRQSEEGVDDAIRTIERELDCYDDDDFTIVEMWRKPSIRRALVVGCVLQFLNQSSGFYRVVPYGSTIFTVHGEPKRSAILLVTVLLGINALLTITVFMAVDRFGRRPLTLISLVGAAAASLLIGIGLNSQEEHYTKLPIKPPRNFEGPHCDIAECTECVYNDYCGFCFIPHSSMMGETTIKGACLPTEYMVGKGSLYGPCKTENANNDYKWTYSHCSGLHENRLLTVVGYIFLVMSFAAGIGPLAWTINTEIYPMWARSTGMACSATVNWIFSAILNMTFVYIKNYITEWMQSYVLCAIAVLGFLFLYVTLPETKDKKLEYTERLFRRKWDFKLFQI